MLRNVYVTQPLHLQTNVTVILIKLMLMITLDCGSDVTLRKLSEHVIAALRYSRLKYPLYWQLITGSMSLFILLL